MKKEVYVVFAIASVLVIVFAWVVTSQLWNQSQNETTTALTREEAIEISRNTSAVQESLQTASGLAPDAEFQPSVQYWNATFISSLKQRHPKAAEYENLPDDHGVWRVFWYIMPPGDLILHLIDELTGQILYEGILYTG